MLTASTAVRTPTASAQHILQGFLNATPPPQAPASSAATPAAPAEAASLLIELRNQTAWCGCSPAGAAAAVATAMHVAQSCGAAPPAPAIVYSTAAAQAAAGICARAPSIRAAGAMESWGVSLIAGILCTIPKPSFILFF